MWPNRPWIATILLRQKGEINEPTELGIRFDDEEDYPLRVPIDPGPQRLSMEEAFDAFTIGTAYLNHLDRETGTVEVGKAADLIVLDRNPFEADPMEIGQGRVLLTLVDGAPVFAAGDLD